MLDKQEYSDQGPTYDVMNPENDLTIRHTTEHKNVLYIKNKHMNYA